MKKLTLILGLLYGPAVSAQSEVTGNLFIAPSQSVSVISMDERPVSFSSITEYASGKTITAYCRIKVKSNLPWRLSASINGEGGSNNGNTIPPGIVSIQVQGANSYVSLGSAPAAILQSSNTNLINEYIINLRIDPKLQLDPAIFLMNLSFKLSPQ